MKIKTQKITISAVLTALALILGLLERWIPIPLPGVKLGLSNIVSLYALYTLGFPYAGSILILRCLLGSIFSGSITGLIYSFSGGLLSLLVMVLSKKASFFSIHGVSVLGASAHSFGQIAAASLMMSSPSVFVYLPVMLAVSVVTGLFVSAITCLILKTLPDPRRMSIA